LIDYNCHYDVNTWTKLVVAEARRSCWVQKLSYDLADCALWEFMFPSNDRWRRRASRQVAAAADDDHDDDDDDDVEFEVGLLVAKRSFLFRL